MCCQNMFFRVLTDVLMEAKGVDLDWRAHIVWRRCSCDEFLCQTRLSPDSVYDRIRSRLLPFAAIYPCVGSTRETLGEMSAIGVQKRNVNLTQLDSDWCTSIGNAHANDCRPWGGVTMTLQKFRRRCLLIKAR